MDQDLDARLAVDLVALLYMCVVPRSEAYTVNIGIHCNVHIIRTWSLTHASVPEGVTETCRLGG